MEYAKLFVLGFGGVVGIPVLKFIWRVAGQWADMSANVATAKATGERTEEAVGKHGERIQRIEQTLHGPEGNNGMYSALRDIERRLAEKEPNPARRSTDKRKKRIA